MLTRRFGSFVANNHSESRTKQKAEREFEQFRQKYFLDAWRE